MFCGETQGWLASRCCSPSEAHATAWVFVFLQISLQMTRTYLAYLDEFGHIGPYVGRDDPKHRTSPVFGLAGYVLPADQVRWFATWFFKRKCELLDFEIRRSGKQAAVWEKKGSSLYTVKNVQRYPAVRSFTYRMFKELHALGGVVFYVGMEKTLPLRQHNPKRLYTAVFREAIKRLDDFCVRDA